MFAQFAWKFIERGISVVPIAPGSKRPGQWSEGGGWRGMSDWTRFSKRMPTELELEHWCNWPGAGIGVILGPISKLVALDKDYDLPNGGNDALQALIPWSPVAKKGEKGWTRFYLFNGERSCSFDVGGLRVLDVLADGRQTVVPPTIHPSGCDYVWITEETLDSLLSVNELPKLPDDFLDQVAAVLLPYQTAQDTQYQKKYVAPADSDQRINTERSIQAEYFHDLNRQALNRLQEWVPRIIPLSVPHTDGYRTVATWRGAKNTNVGVHPSGIFDFGGNYGMTPLTLVMHANGLPFGKAAEVLRACLALNEPAPIKMTVGGAATTAPVVATAQTSALATPVLMPWQKPSAASVAPPVVMLPPATSLDPAPAVPSFISNPPGILGEIARWITATAPKSQPELSVAAAIALCSVVMGRAYRSQFGNYTSLYLILVARSTEGKEHPQGCVEKILAQSDLVGLIGGSGYTSAGGVYSALLKAPAHIVTIDEIGKLLKSSRANGNAHSEAAIDKLVEAFGRTDGVLRPPTYSTMTLKDGAKPAERVVHQPAITMLGATTPGTFYANLSTDLVKDGFLGRCLVVESHQPRQLTRFVDRTNPPYKIVEWCQAVHVSGASPGNLAGVGLSAEIPANTIALPFGAACMDLMHAFEAELNDAKNEGEAEGLDVLLGRTLEKAMKLAMICCKAESKDNHEVRPEHLAWAINYVRHYDMAMVRAVRENRDENEVDGQLKKVVAYIGQARKMAGNKAHAKLAHVLAAGAMPHAMLLKAMHMKSRDFEELMKTAVDSGLVKKPLAVMLGLDYGGEIYLCAAPQ